MSYLGDFALGATFDTKFTTVATTGAPTTLAGSPVISAYPDNSTTQLTAGITLTVDFDSVTGLHNIRVVATGGNGYASGSNYQLVITTGTVAGTSVVGYVVAEFSIEARSALRPATAGRTLVVDANGLADANTVKVGPTGSGTAQTAGDIIGDTNDIQSRLPAALTADGNIKADTLRVGGTLQTAGDIIADTNDIQARLPAALTGAGNIKAEALVVSDKTGYALTQAFPANFSALTISAGGNVSITSGIKKNTALANFEFLMTDSTNHAPATGKTVTVTRSVNNGAFGAGTLSAVTEIGVGIYSVDFGAGDLNGTAITLRATATGCDDLLVTIVPDP